jgi:hypothetical protein
MKNVVTAKRTVPIAAGVSALLFAFPVAAQAVPRSDACGSKACGSATPTTWGNTYVYVSESVSRTNCSSGAYAAAYVEGYFANGKYVRGSSSVLDYYCDGKYVAKNNVKIDEGGSKLIKFRVYVTMASSTYIGNWVDNPYT